MSTKQKPSKPETSPQLLREALLRRADRHITTKGRITFKCIPGLLDHYLGVLDTIFKACGRPYSKSDLDALRKALAQKLDEGFRISPYSRLLVEYYTEPSPSDALTYVVSARIFSLPDLMKDWVETRKPPLFGAHPDAMVMDVARSLGAAQQVAVLDLGAGTGRNAIPLAKAGHPVTAVEEAPAMLEQLRAVAREQQVTIETREANFLEDSFTCTEGAYDLAFLSEVVSHFRSPAEIRRMLRLMASALKPGGTLLFNAFLAHDSYTPDKAAREASQAVWASLFTRRELAEAAEGLPFERIGDESVHDYEKQHLPANAWPPTGWFVSWATGQDVFNLLGLKAPMELRWLTWRRT